MTPQFHDALCLGQGELFESTVWADHVEARSLCQKCPEFIKCDRELQAVLLASGTFSGSGPQGTWAGRLYGAKGRRVEVSL